MPLISILLSFLVASATAITGSDSLEYSTNVADEVRFF